jgi:calcineurin-like phosphoesterase family protein
MESNVEGSNFGEKSTFVDLPENDIGSSDQFIGNFLAEPGDLSNIVKSKIWVTSDTHFHHRNILIYEAASRPWSDRDQMDRAMIQRWNERVGPNDVVFHLGDFSFGSKGRVRDIVSKLKGKIFLLLGNHDREQWDWNWLDLGFDRVFKHPFLMDGKFIFSHEPLGEIPEGKVNIYGHVHGSKYYNTKDDNRLCACVERWDCAPIEYEHIKSLF